MQRETLMSTFVGLAGFWLTIAGGHTALADAHRPAPVHKLDVDLYDFAVTRDDQRAAGARPISLDANAMAALRNIGAPILLPQQAQSGSVYVFSGGGAFHIGWRDRGRAYALYGSSVAREISKADDAPAYAGGMRFSGSSEELTMSFTRFGAAYGLTQYCMGGRDADPGCHNKDNLRAMAKTLVAVSGGNGREIERSAVPMMFAPPVTPLPRKWRKEPGDLLRGSTTIKTDEGVTDPRPVAPHMSFPFADGPAFANSQLFGKGGGGYANGRWRARGGAENDKKNFDYPWRDNFCEVRLDPKHANPFCPGGKGHKGQDLRPKTCANAVHWLAAPEPGVITHVGAISVEMMGAITGLKYRFFHIQAPLPAWVQTGAALEARTPFALVSDRASPTSRATTVHVHFEIHGTALIDGALYTGALPPYSSLVAAYERFARDNPDAINPAPPAPAAQCANPQWP